MINKEILKQMGFKMTQENVYSFYNFKYSEKDFIVCFNGMRCIHESSEIVIAEEITAEMFFKKFFDFIHCDGQCYGDLNC